MAEKNVDEEIKKKHREFDEDIANYLNQFRMGGAGLSPEIQQLRLMAGRARLPRPNLLQR